MAVRRSSIEEGYLQTREERQVQFVRRASTDERNLQSVRKLPVTEGTYPPDRRSSTDERNLQPTHRYSKTNGHSKTRRLSTDERYINPTRRTSTGESNLQVARRSSTGDNEYQPVRRVSTGDGQYQAMEFSRNLSAASTPKGSSNHMAVSNPALLRAASPLYSLQRSNTNSMVHARNGDTFIIPRDQKAPPTHMLNKRRGSDPITIAGTPFQVMDDRLPAHITVKPTQVRIRRENYDSDDAASDASDIGETHPVRSHMADNRSDEDDEDETDGRRSSSRVADDPGEVEDLTDQMEPLEVNHHSSANHQSAWKAASKKDKRDGEDLDETVKVGHKHKGGVLNSLRKKLLHRSKHSKHQAQEDVS